LNCPPENPFVLTRGRERTCGRNPTVGGRAEIKKSLLGKRARENRYPVLSRQSVKMINAGENLFPGKKVRVMGRRKRKKKKRRKGFFPKE